jgi:hypothetical protein
LPKKQSEDRRLCEAQREYWGISMTEMASEALFGNVSTYSRFIRGERELSDLSIRRLSQLTGIAVSTFHRHREERRRKVEGSA